MVPTISDNNTKWISSAWFNATTCTCFSVRFNVRNSTKQQSTLTMIYQKSCTWTFIGSPCIHILVGCTFKKIINFLGSTFSFSIYRAWNYDGSHWHSSINKRKFWKMMMHIKNISLVINLNFISRKKRYKQKLQLIDVAVVLHSHHYLGQSRTRSAHVL